jgi:hypothetical protein
MHQILKISLFLILFLNFSNCGGLSKTNTREIPTNAQERARKNVEEGRAASVAGMFGRRGGGSFEFSSSNPMWRASLEILDFIPMTTVDYSGGMIISDWYTGEEVSNNEFIKISVRFLSNEIRSDSLKIIVHKKKCTTSQNCKVSLLSNSKISEELRSTILRKASLIEIELKNKKKKKK